VNPAIIASARRRDLKSINEGHGTLISINGAFFRATTSIPSSDAPLGVGGFDTEWQVNVWWPVGLAPVPAIGSTLVLVDQKLSFKIKTPPVIRPGAMGQAVHVVAIRE
jgi:hypothetical protein